MRITFITNPHTCNQSCDICFAKQAPLGWEQTQEMDFALIEKTVEAFLPHGLEKIIPSTIGEPFLYSHFEELLKLAKRHNIKVNITTNGTFPNGGIERWAPLLQPVLNNIKFSAMHGRVPQSIGEVVSGKWLEASKISIQATLGKGDILDEIPKGVSRVKINEPWILGHEAYNIGRDCQFLGKDIWVWVDGTFQVCPNPDARFGMKTKFPFGDFGNFATQNPLEIWNGKKYREFCKNYKENPICKNCKMRCLF